MHSTFISRVLLPLCCGAVVYVVAKNNPSFSVVRNYLPDGLWAFACVSCLLLIWKDKVNLFWICTAFISFMVFEWLQYLQVIQGTADLIDASVYIVFASLALLVHKIFNHKTPPNEQTQ